MTSPSYKGLADKAIRRRIDVAFRNWVRITAKNMKKTIILSLILLVAPLLGVAGTFRYAEDQAPAIANPLFTTTMSEARLNELVFDSLFNDNAELATTPSLVESMEQNERGTELTLHLRQDIEWHDGQPFTAKDVVFTINAMKDHRTLSTEAGRAEWIASVSSSSEYTVNLVFEEPEATPQDKLYFKILPAHRFDSTEVKRTDNFRASPIGTGPYELKRYNDDNSITLQKSEGYRKDLEIPEIVMREVSDKNYQAKLLLYESLEALVRVLPRDLAVLQNNRKVELYPYQTNSWWYLGFNLERAPFDDVRVRQAISYMVDIEGLLAPIGTGDIITGPFVKSSPYYNHKVSALAPNQGRVQTLLEEAGYTYDGNRWSKKGVPLSIRIKAHKGIESSQEVVINLQSQLQAAGVEVEVDFLDKAHWKASVWKDRDFDTILSQWSFDRNEDIREQFHSEGTRNFTTYSNEEVDALLTLSRTTRDPQEKKQALRKLHALVHDDTPMVFLWTLDSYSAMSTKVNNVVIHPFYFFTWVSDWESY